MPTNNPLVCVIDDDPDILQLTEFWLKKHGFAFSGFESGDAFFASLDRLLPDAICLDINLPQSHGLDVLRDIKYRNADVPVLMLTANAQVSSVVDAMQAGAYNYLTKPVIETQFIASISNAVEHHRMSIRLRQLDREVHQESYANIIGQSLPMKQLYRQMDKVAASDISVLLHGESGSGKEVVAQALHDQSHRCKKAFVALNCAAIADNLSESEFFGHEKGAFTGAHALHKGRLEQAHQGTLFLDEIAELDLGIQAKLLRALQEKKFRRVGGTQVQHSDFRLIAASHKNLWQEVEKGHFREDLYYRVAIFELSIPALRERLDDLHDLLQFFLDKHSPKQNGKQSIELSSKAYDLLQSYDWPGNIRELSNAVARACVACDKNIILPKDLPSRIAQASKASPHKKQHDILMGTAIYQNNQNQASDTTDLSLEAIEKQSIIEAIKRSKGNLSAAVRQLGMGRTTLYRKLKKYNIQT